MEVIFKYVSNIAVCLIALNIICGIVYSVFCLKKYRVCIDKDIYYIDKIGAYKILDGLLNTFISLVVLIVIFYFKNIDKIGIFI